MSEPDEAGYKTFSAYDTEIGHMTDKKSLNGSGSDGSDRALLDETIVSHSTSSSAVTSVNITKHLIGAGIITTPWAYAKGSLVPSILVMVVVYFASLTSFMLLGSGCAMTGALTYTGIWESAWGKRFSWVASVVMCMQNGLSATAYCRLIGQFLEQLLKLSDGVPEWIMNDVFLCSIMVALIMLPLCMLKDLSMLRYSSSLGLLAVVYLASFVVIHAATDENSPAEDMEVWNIDLGIVQCINTLALTFSCHTNTTVYYKELENRSVPRFLVAAARAFTSELLLVGLVAVGGYVNFGEKVLDNILYMYDTDNGAAIAARAMQVTSLVMSFPLVMHAVRRAVDQLYQRAKGMSTHETPNGRRRLQAFLCVATVWGLAVLTLVFNINVGPLFSLNGAINATLMTFIFPATMYLSLPDSTRHRGKRAFVYFIVVFGLFSGVVGFVLTIMEIIDDQNDDPDPTLAATAAPGLLSLLSLPGLSL